VVLPSRCIIITYFDVTNPYKKSNGAQQQFLENLVLYTNNGYMPFSTCENIWLWNVLHQCPPIVFLYCTTLVEEMSPIIITKTMELHVLLKLTEATTMFIELWMPKGNLNTFVMVSVSITLMILKSPSMLPLVYLRFMRPQGFPWFVNCVLYLKNAI
jgi:hypothetical protein